MRAAYGVLAATATLLVGASGPPAAHAAFGLDAFDGSVLDADGGAFTQAGGHPFDATVHFDLNTTTDSEGNIEPEGGTLRNASVELPPGLVGNPTAVPRCPGTENLRAFEAEDACPIASQVGIAITRIAEQDQVDQFVTPVFSVTPPPGIPARFGFAVSQVPILLDAVVRSDGDYGVSIETRNLSESVTVLGSSVTLWGVPADAGHDNQRCLGFPLPIPECFGAPGTPIGPNPFPPGIAAEPLIANPTRCTEPGVGLETTLRVESWNQPSDTDSASFESHFPPGFPEPPENWGEPVGPTGCDQLPFEPEMSVRPTSSAADSPTGLEVELSVPQDGLLNPDGLATAHLKRAEVTLPEGMAINPSAADGLEACTPDEIGLRGTNFPDPSRIRFTDSPPRCPDASKLGTVEIETPLLEEPLRGSVFQAEQDRNPFNSTFALYLTARGSGVQVKLPGEITPDPETGQITATFDENPQLPFSSLRVTLKGGPRAPLVTPPTTGTHTTTTRMSPWSAQDPDNPTAAETVTDADSFQITSGPNRTSGASTMASRPFGLGFTAGVRNPQAAARSPLTVRLSRPDGHQEIQTLDVELPQGVAASLRGVPLCSEQDARNANCGPESQIGTVQAAAGAGSSPFWITDGKVFLTGPYKGAPLGLSVVVPAVAGPFDLGEVAVRAALFVDKTDAHITVQSDPIPQILEGVPLRAREMRIRIDRPDFSLAGTSCDELQVSAEANGISGASTQLAERFQLSGCRGLGFNPKFRFRALGKKATKRLAHPRLRATVRPKPRGGANANISRAKVTLPRGIELDQDNLARPCTRPQFADEGCPNRTKVGRAVARSPLLPDPLRGPVFIVTSDNELPDLVADLNGIVDVDLRGRIDTTRRSERIRNTFEVVPDVPVNFFRLNLKGGRRQGLLINSTDRCENRRQNRIKVGVRGHNGRSANQRPLMRVKQCKKRKNRG